MVFSSGIFLFLFLPFVLAVYYNPFVKNRAFRNVFLYVSSLLFYAYGEPIYVFMMVLSTVITWAIGVLFGRQGRKIYIYVGVLYHVIVLLVFKYLTFIASQVGLLIGRTSSFSITLPIGISFMTFQMMSYLLDISFGRVPVQKQLLKVGLYISMFPQLIAGPIVRYESIEHEITERVETWEDIEEGIFRFSVGLCKKVLIADNLSLFCDRIFASSQSAEIGALTAWIGSITYTLQIYYDFSGYSDMALGLGRCFGFHFSENFNYPYIAKSVTDFWRRWHISLTDWFRDYVYIPLGGNRHGKRVQIRNTIIVWLLTGIWHGANWTFLLWGCIYCVVQLAEKYLYSVDKWPLLIRRVYTLMIVNLCWVLFKSDNIAYAVRYIFAMCGHNGLIDINSIAYFHNTWIMIVLGIIGAIPVVRNLLALLDKKQAFASQTHSVVSNWIRGAVYCAGALSFILAVMTIISGGYSPFIYYDF